MVVTPLGRKLIRDLRLWAPQILAIAAVAACGVMAFVTMQTNYDAMYDAQASYYADYRFADVFAGVTRAPNDTARRIEALPFVQRVQTRVVEDVIADVPNRDDAVTLRLIGIPAGEQPALNRLYLRRGRLPAPESRNEAVVSEAFSQANGVDVGSALHVLLNGRRQLVRVVGVALSPEYVYEMRGGADIWPDSRHFGIAWMNDAALAAAYDMTGAFNDVAVKLAPGGDVREAIERLDAILASSGSLGAYGRSDQFSDRFVDNELRQLRAQAVAIPLIFLGVAAFLINASLSRLVATQREQIAVLKAFGYTNGAVAFHYIQAAIVTVGLGTIAGVLSGWWLGYRLALLYTKFFRFPEVVFHLRPGIVLVSAVISLAAGIAGAAFAVRAAVLLPPAEAMRPPAPLVFRPTILERAGITKFFSAAFRMVARGIERKPLSSLITVVAIAFSVAILLVGRSTLDSVHWMMNVQFEHVAREDATITFVRPLSAAARLDLRSLPGVVESEPYRSIFARVSNGHRSRRLVVTGVASFPRLHRIVDRNLRAFLPPAHGVLLTRALARILEVGPGSTIDVSFLEGERNVVRLPVAGVVDELVGLNVYVDLAELNRLLHEDAVTSGAYVRLDPSKLRQFDAAVKATPKIAGIAYRQAALDEFQRSFAESIGISAAFILGFAFVIAFGVVYNSGRITFSERLRELGTLRILGYSRLDVTLVLAGEQLLLTLAAVPVGFLIGHALNRALQPLYELEYYRVPTVVSNQTYVFACAFVLFAAGLSAAALALQVRRLDIVAALKAGE